MIGCSNSNAFKVGETEFSNEEVDKVKSILTATQSYTDADYLAQFKESKDNDDKIKQEVISYMIDNEVVYQQAQKEKIKVMSSYHFNRLIVCSTSSFTFPGI